MKIRPDEPDLSKFDDSARQLGDEDLANRLAKLFSSLEQGTVAIFNGGWGVGKTTFIRRWHAQLAESATPSVYLDAFTVDYLESPFVAVAGAIVQALENAHKEKDPKYVQFVRAASKVGRSLAATATKVGIKAATLGVVDARDLGEGVTKAIDSVADAAADYAENSIRALIESHTARQKEVVALKQSLAQLPALLAPDPTARENPLVVIIDELDRCRPDFALGLLEILKHFFRAKKTHFVLVVNREQLENSITHRYGNGINASEYLRKFYDFQIDYEIDYSDKHDSRIQNYIGRLNNSLLPNNEDSRYIRDYIGQIARAHQLSLRDVENVYTNLALAYAVIDTKYRPALLVAVLSVLKVISPRTYAKAKTGQLTFSELNNVAFAGRDWGDFDIDRLRNVFQWHLTKDLDEKDPRWASFGSELWRYSLDRLQTIKFIANAIIDRFEPPPSQTAEPATNKAGVA